MSHPAPFHIQYTLTRSQRLVPHLRIWAPWLPGVLVLVGGLLVLVVRVSLWYLPLAVVTSWLVRGFVAGLIEATVCPLRTMDILIEKGGLGFLAGGQRWWVPLDGVLWVRQLHPDVWTVHHHNGSVINLLASAVPAEQIERLRQHARNR